MKYIIWKRQVEKILLSQFDSIQGWETWVNWQDYYIKRMTALDTVSHVKKILGDAVS